MKAKLWFLVLSPFSISAQPPQPAVPTAPPISIPRVLSRAVPEYTPEARAAGLQGRVVLYLEVETDGSPSKIQVLHGLGLGLDAKAIEAAAKWRFAPGTRDKIPTKFAQSADVEFKSDNPDAWRIRLAAFSVNHNEKGRSELRVKPVLSHYVAPDVAGCPADGASVLVRLTVGTNGIPRNVKSLLREDAAAEAVTKAIASWTFVPATANRKPREAAGEIEFECGRAAVSSPRTAAEILRAGKEVTPPVPVFKPEPEYTDRARRNLIHGEVVLRGVIDAAGRVRDLVVVSPLGSGLDQNAVEAVKRWRFKPGTQNGQPVAVQAIMAVQFRLI